MKVKAQLKICACIYMRLAIAPGPTIHWLFRSYDLFSKFSAMAKLKPHKVKLLFADHSLNSITRLSSLEYRRATNFCACGLPFRQKSESGRTWLKTIFLFAYLSGTIWPADDASTTRCYRIRRSKK